MTTIAPGERYTRYAGIWEGDFVTAAYHTDCREWEIHLCHEAGLNSDEWCSLSEHVAADGDAVLEGAPKAVRARFAQPVT